MDGIISHHNMIYMIGIENDQSSIHIQYQELPGSTTIPAMGVHLQADGGWIRDAYDCRDDKHMKI